MGSLTGHRSPPPIPGSIVSGRRPGRGLGDGEQGVRERGAYSPRARAAKTLQVDAVHQRVGVSVYLPPHAIVAAEYQGDAQRHVLVGHSAHLAVLALDDDQDHEVTRRVGRDNFQLGLATPEEPRGGVQGRRVRLRRSRCSRLPRHWRKGHTFHSVAPSCDRGVSGERHPVRTGSGMIRTARVRSQVLADGRSLRECGGAVLVSPGRVGVRVFDRVDRFSVAPIQPAGPGIPPMDAGRSRRRASARSRSSWAASPRRRLPAW